jgi:hypothetical protein
MLVFGLDFESEKLKLGRKIGECRDLKVSFRPGWGPLAGFHFLSFID